MVARHFKKANGGIFMKIEEILGQEIFSTLTDEQKKSFEDKEYFLTSDGNYIPKAKFDSLNELNKDLKKQLEETNSKVQELSKVNPDDLNAKLTELQTKYDNDTQALNNKIAEQEYNYKINDYVKDIEFSSKSAKKSFIEDLKNKHLEFNGDNLVGFDDFKKEYEENDPTTFVIKQKVNVDTGGAHVNTNNNDDEFVKKVMGLN